MTVTLGECLSAADQHFREAEEGAARGVRDYAALAVQMRRLVTVLDRYLDSAGTAPLAAGHAQADWEGAAGGIRAELRVAGMYLGQALPPEDDPVWRTGVSADPAVAGYTQAVDALLAGSELLRTHAALDTGGVPVPRSDWLQVLSAEPVVTALAEEVTRWARRAGRMTDQVLGAPDHAQRLSGTGLAAAREWLVRVASADRRIGDAGLDAAARRELLCAIPDASAPERASPVPGESVEQLIAGISTSARRLRADAFETERQRGDSPALSGGAWRKTAYASAITCDLASKALGSIAQSPPAGSGIAAADLRDAASAFTVARDTWLQTASMWQSMTTDTTLPMSPAATDATDLVVRLGRLTTGDADWVPGNRKQTVVQDAGLLVSGAGGLPAVLGALHEAADAVTRAACADLTALRAVRGAGRLYMSARVTGDMTSRYAYVKPPAGRADMLENAHYLCADSTWQAAAMLDRLALRVDAPTKTLALVREAVPVPAYMPRPSPEFELDFAAFARYLPRFRQPRGARPQITPQLKAPEIIHAYKRKQRTLEQCAEEFSIPASRVAFIIAAHSHSPRTGDSRRQRSPAHLAAADGPRTADDAVRSAASFNAAGQTATKSHANRPGPRRSALHRCSMLWAIIRMHTNGRAENEAAFAGSGSIQ